MTPFSNKPILVPVDLSETSDRAVDFAKELAESPKGITLLHIGVPYTPVESPYMYLSDAVTRRNQLEEEVHAHFAGERFRGMHVQVRYGDPGHEIADFAKELGAGLIVMPSHGRTGLSHLLVGSVAERVMRYAQCPVLVLRTLAAGATPVVARVLPG